MKIKVLALTFSMLFFGGITATSFAQVLASTNTITVVDNDDDKNKKKKKAQQSVMIIKVQLNQKIVQLRKNAVIVLS